MPTRKQTTPTPLDSPKRRDGRITVCLGETLRRKVERRAAEDLDPPSTFIRKLVERYFLDEAKQRRAAA